MKKSVTCLSLAMLLIPALARAEEFPAKPVTIVVASTAGGATDVLGRHLADNLSKLWKQPVLVENRGGAGGSIATGYVSKSKPDGYTLLIVANTLTTNAAVQRNLPFDSVKDIQPISMVARGQMLIVTGNRVPMPTIASIVREAKAQKIFYGTSGPGTAPTFASELLGVTTGIKLEQVNYKGATEALTDMAGGRIDIYIASVSQMLPFIQNKTATPVAIMSTTRSKTLPSVPTVVEEGYPSALFDLWYGVFGPAGIPPEVTAKINESIKAVTNSPVGIDFLSKNGAMPTEVKVDEFTKTVAHEIQQWKELAQKLNLFEK
jgi:tripartite-type tricarboxylate transporter receptor subunit TctC